MKKLQSSIFLFLILSFVLLNCKNQPTVLPTPEEKSPYYFIAIHNEPVFSTDLEYKLSCEALARMVKKADEYNIKLTLMFSAQWVNLSCVQANLDGWRENGHEIAAHHHSIYHGSWDGYTNYQLNEAIEKRFQVRCDSNKDGVLDDFELLNCKSNFQSMEQRMRNSYIGTLSDFMDELKEINPLMNSGCVNDEADKKFMPDEIIYDACSGYANYGEPLQVLRDSSDELVGLNEYITTGYVGGIKRYWLTHYQITKEANLAKAIDYVKTMKNHQVYGAVTHSFSDLRHEELKSQEEYFYEFIEELHKLDPQGSQSRTMTQIIEGGILKEVEVEIP